MTETMQPRLETSSTGSKTLIVPYQGDRFKEVIDEAERRFDLVWDRTITVVTIPARWKKDAIASSTMAWLHKKLS